jgi:hypothetical protein
VLVEGAIGPAAKAGVKAARNATKQQVFMAAVILSARSDGVSLFVAMHHRVRPG